MATRAFVVQEILSGRRRGFAAGALRAGLWLLSCPYRLGVAARNRAYDRGLRAVTRVDCRVISVGNLTVGGVGKTPLVELITRRVLEKTDKVVIVSRGYGAREGEKNDEQMLLCENLPGVPQVSGGDRVVCAIVARRKHDARVIVLDDAFQHRRIARDLDIVAVDATNPFGYGYLLPRGLLRESPRSLARAHVVVITRSAHVTPEELAALDEKVCRLAPNALIVHAVEEVTRVEPAGASSETLAPDALRGKSAVAFSGLGNPDQFRRTLAALGVQFKGFFVFGDHHRYETKHLRAVDSVARAENADVVLTTQKDRVKLPAGFDWQKPVLVVKIEMRLTQNEAEFLRRLDEIVGDAAQGVPSPSGRGSG